MPDNVPEVQEESILADGTAERVYEREAPILMQIIIAYRFCGVTIYWC